MAQQNNQNARKKNDTGFVVLVSGVIVLAIILGAIVGAGVYVAGRKTIFPNITVAGVDVGGMTYETARSTLLGSNAGTPTGIQATAVLTSSVSVSVTSDEAGLTLPITEAVDVAYSYGRTGNFFKNLGSFISCVSQPHEVYSEQSMNESGVRGRQTGERRAGEYGRRVRIVHIKRARSRRRGVLRLHRRKRRRGRVLQAENEPRGQVRRAERA